jgi:nucleotide-binding universal stress UspA family protein
MVEHEAVLVPGRRRPVTLRRITMTMLVTVAQRRSSEAGAAGRTVVVEYDCSDEAREALGRAAQRAGPYGRVVIVDGMPAPADVLDTASDDEVGAHEHRGQEIRADIAAADLGAVGVEIELDGDSLAEALAGAARFHDADEIVVGSRGVGPIRALMASWWCGGALSAAPGGASRSAAHAERSLR